MISVLPSVLLSASGASAAPFPDPFTFHNAPTEIEQKLFVLSLEHRFQETFHASPDYALWYGWSEMSPDLTEIQTAGSGLRKKN